MPSDFGITPNINIGIPFTEVDLAYANAKVPDLPERSMLMPCRLSYSWGTNQPLGGRLRIL